MILDPHHPEQHAAQPWSGRRLLLVAVLIGLVAGTAAWAFRLLIALIHNLAFFGVLSVTAEAEVHTPTARWGPWVVLVPMIFGIGVIWLIRNFAPEAKGHGVPEVMDAIYYRRGRIRGQVSVVKALASALTIGSGGSLGREGPIVQIGAAFSSGLAQWLKMPMNQRNLLIACGASGGIAATFNAPLGGILFSVELLLLSVSSRTLMPVIIAAVVAANMGRYLIGPDPAFHVPGVALTGGEESLPLLLVYTVFAALVGVLALAFIKSVYWSEDFFERLPLGPYQRHLLGMFGLGLLMFGFHEYAGHYYVQGVGYATIQDLVSGTLTSPWLIVLLLGGKLLATLLTIGSGGSGGVFSPSLYLGACAGGAAGYALVAVAPGLGVDPLTLTLVGMAAMVAATTSAPMTAAIMTYELTLDYVVVLPIMIGVAVAYGVRLYFSSGDIYTIKLLRRGRRLPEGRFADVNSQIGVDDIMDKGIELVRVDDIITGGDKTCCAVDADERVIGIINPMRYREGIDFRAGDAMLTDFVVLRAGMSLRQAFQVIGRSDSALALVSADGSTRADQVRGVLNPYNLTRVMANASLMQEHDSAAN
ncbi:MAG: chloride channel protein [Gammaproteobacteria bacterium]|nr:chloride channel protein [Gammaproteobacteria bacterium]MCP5199927.1 chloride channel protein [Gammaproteobacteria bacterium]